MFYRMVSDCYFVVFSISIQNTLNVMYLSKLFQLDTSITLQSMVESVIKIAISSSVIATDLLFFFILELTEMCTVGVLVQWYNLNQKRNNSFVVMIWRKSNISYRVN